MALQDRPFRRWRGRTRSERISEMLNGVKRHGVLKTTEITRSRWDCIIEDAEALVSADDDGDDYADDDGNEPRTLVVLD